MRRFPAPAYEAWFGARAVLVAGSWARGEALPGSDLDLYAILADGEPATFAAVEEDGIFVERTGMDGARARAKIATNPMSWATFLDGVALVDDGVVASLRGAAEEARGAWRPDPDDVRGCAHWLRSAVVKVEACLAAGEEARAAFAAQSTTFELARGIFLVNGRPIMAAGAVWGELGRLASRPDGLEEILLGADVTTRCEAFVRAARWTIARLEETVAHV